MLAIRITVRALVVLSLGLLAAPPAVEAQQAGRTYRIGVYRWAPLLPDRLKPSGKDSASSVTSREKILPSSGGLREARTSSLPLWQKNSSGSRLT